MNKFLVNNSLFNIIVDKCTDLSNTEHIIIIVSSAQNPARDQVVHVTSSTKSKQCL